MCDYSLHGVASRPAKVGDKLITTEFGFSAVDEPDVAVCLLPGTELAFEAEVQRQYDWIQAFFFNKKRWNTGQKRGRYRQVEIDIDNPATHHDAIEFHDGRVVFLTRLKTNQRATVLQLPARAPATAEPRIDERADRPVFAH